MFDQTEFARVVKDYNTDYVLLLKRASKRHYDCLVSSFLVLRDLHNVIELLHDAGKYTYTETPHPFSFRAADALLAQLGFDAEEIRNIYGFLDHVKHTEGMEFEDCLDADPAALCARLRRAS